MNEGKKRFVKLLGVSICCLMSSATPCRAGDLTPGPAVDPSTVLIDNQAPDQSSKALLFSDNRNSNPGQPAGLILGFNGKFADADFSESKDDPFGDNPNAPMVDFYLWPKVGTYNQGGISSQNPSMPDNINGPMRQPLTRNVQCYVSVIAAAGHIPPPNFPLVQLNGIELTDVGIMNRFFNNGRDEKTGLYQHDLRLDFAGGYIQCTVGDDNLTRKWTAADVIGAFGNALSVNQPQSTAQAAAASLNRLRKSQSVVGPFSSLQYTSVPGAEYRPFGERFTPKISSDDASCADCEIHTSKNGTVNSAI